MINISGSNFYLEYLYLKWVVFVMNMFVDRYLVIIDRCYFSCFNNFYDWLRRLEFGIKYNVIIIVVSWWNWNYEKRSDLYYEEIVIICM